LAGNFGGRSENDFDVLQLPICNVLSHQLDHSRLDVLANHLACRADNFRQPPHVIAHAGADVRNDGTFLDLQSSEHPIRFFFSDPLRTREPVGPAHPHDGSGLPLRLRIRSEYKR
jgi:hypothetical protein